MISNKHADKNEYFRCVLSLFTQRTRTDTIQTLNKEELQDYWVSGLCPSSGIVDTGKHNVSGTESVFVLR
jgi:hypothetical protein